MSINELQTLIEKHEKLADHTLTLSIPRKSKLWYEFASCPRWPSKASATHDVVLVTVGKAKNAIAALTSTVTKDDET